MGFFFHSSDPKPLSDDTTSQRPKEPTTAFGNIPIPTIPIVSPTPEPIDALTVPSPFGGQHPHFKPGKPLPLLFVPTDKRSTSFNGLPLYKADPSSFLMAYPRANIDQIHEFYSLYNPPKSFFWN